jgi:hypothetical protein
LGAIAAKSMLTLKIFDTSIEAHLLKSRLESEGIPSYIFDENIVTLNPLYNNLVGGVKLKISALDLDRAQKILDEIEAKDVSDDEGRTVSCPRCGSSKFHAGYKSIKSARGLLAFIVSLLFVVYPLYYKSVKKCKICGFEF